MSLCVCRLVVLVVVGRVVKESVLFKGPYCASMFVAVFKYVAMFGSVVLVVVGVVVAKKVVSSFFVMSKRIELFKHK